MFPNDPSKNSGLFADGDLHAVSSLPFPTLGGGSGNSSRSRSGSGERSGRDSPNNQRSLSRSSSSLHAPPSLGMRQMTLGDREVGSMGAEVYRSIGVDVMSGGAGVDSWGGMDSSRDSYQNSSAWYDQRESFQQRSGLQRNMKDQQWQPPKEQVAAPNNISNFSHLMQPLLVAEVVATSPPVPKVMPEWIDQQTSFCLSGHKASAVFELILTVLVANNVDHEADSRRFKIKAAVFAPLATKIRVRLYSRGTDIIVEFQKRQGCTATCFQLYRTVSSKFPTAKRLGSSEPLRAPRPVSPFAATLYPGRLSPLPTNTSSRAGLQEAKLDELVKNLADMVKSKYLDEKLQALSDLVVLSQQHDLTYLDNASGQCTDVLQLVLPELQSEDDDIVRCAALILVNLTKRVQQHVTNQNNNTEGPTTTTITAAPSGAILTPLFGVLSSPHSLVNLDTKRQVSVAVEQLAGAGTTFSSQQREQVRKLVRHSDMRLREIMMRTAKMLEAL